MQLIDLIRKNRSYRRFDQDEMISEATLCNMVEAARLSPSGKNLQPLKYVLCNTDEVCAHIFEHIGWAGYLSEWPGPEDGERPTAYIVQLLDTAITTNPGIDAGIAAQSILLQAVEIGYGGCMIGTFNQEKIRKLLYIPETYTITLVIALGKPKEEVRIEPMMGNNVKYWRDSEQVHHVPKRPLEELIVRF